MGQSRHLTGRFGRPRGLRRFVTLVALLCVAGVLCGYFYLTDSDRLAGLAGRMLSDLTGAEVRISSARFNADASITLRGVKMRVPGVGGEHARLFDAEEVLVKHRLRSLARGSFEARQITFVRGVLHRTEDAGTGKSNFQLLQESRAVGPDTGEPLRLPEILIRNGGVRFGEVSEGRYRWLGAVRVEGRLSPLSGGVERYAFSIRQLIAEGGGRFEPGPAAVGELDLGTSAFWAEVEALSFQGDQRMLLPFGFRQWWDRLAPDGALSEIRLGYDPEGGNGFSAEVKLEGVGLTLPFGESGWRMHDVSGRIDVEGEGIQVSGLEGRVEGIGYTIDGMVDGFSKDAPLRFAVVTEPFTVSEDPHYVPALPAGVQKLFHQFAPQGTFAVNALLERAELGGRLNYSGNVLVSDAQVRFHLFRYPLEGVTGRVRFDEELVEVQELVGRGPSGAAVRIQGKISPPNDLAAVSMRIEASDAPLDEYVYAALPPDRLKVVREFLAGHAHAGLVRDGLILTGQGREDALEELVGLRARMRDDDSGTNVDLGQRVVDVERRLSRPVFELGGRLNLVADVTRTYGRGKRFATSVRLDLTGMRVLYRYWPYPLVVQSGELLIRPGEAEVVGVVAEGLSGGLLKGEGTVSFTRIEGAEGAEQVRVVPRLEIKAKRVPCDAYLFASVPSHRRGMLTRLGASGLLSGGAKVYSTESGKIEYALDLALSEGELMPQETDVVIRDVSGRLEVGPRGVEIETLAGRLWEAELSGSAWSVWGEGPGRYGLALDVEGLVLDQRLGGLVPGYHPVSGRLRDLVEVYHPDGQADVGLTVSGVYGAERYRVVVEPSELSFDLKGQRVHFGDMAGRVVVEPGVVSLDACGGSFGTGRVVATGSVGLEPGGRTELRIDAFGERVCPTTRLVLPEVVLGVIDGLELDGAYRSRGATLWVDRRTGAFEFECALGLEGGRAVIGVPVTGLVGEFDIKASRGAGDAWPRMDLRLDADRLLAAERVVSPLSVRLATGREVDTLLVQDLRGACYGGVLIGSGRVWLAEQGAYTLGLTLEDVALDPFIHPAEYKGVEGIRAGMRDGTAEVAPVDPVERVDPKVFVTPRKKRVGSPTGVLAANLTIEGSPVDGAARRGRGELEIRGASLYEVPLAMALMQVVNLSWPASKAFDRASANYLIDGDDVRFDWISLEAPTVQMRGSGTMKYSTLALDLEMITRNPGGEVFGPVGDLFAVFKDELVRIHVGGTLDEPVPKVKSFTGIKRTWDDLFGPPHKPGYAPLDGEPTGQGGRPDTDGDVRPGVDAVQPEDGAASTSGQ